MSLYFTANIVLELSVKLIDVLKHWRNKRELRPSGNVFRLELDGARDSVRNNTASIFRTSFPQNDILYPDRLRARLTQSSVGTNLGICVLSKDT